MFLIYNRLSTTKEVFQIISRAKPARLYVAGDGPKEIVSEDREKVSAVRQYVLNNINWDCSVKTFLRERNVGCGKAVSDAITWFFENEEMGIILEDDTLPSLSFFWFCQELLRRYKDNKKIGMISGCNFQNGKKRGDGDYYFSLYSHIWGWASWRDRWQNYEFSLDSFKDISFIEEIFTDRNIREYWKMIFHKMKRHEIDTWDYQWTFTLWKNKQLSILPNVNLVTNIGFGDDGTHLKRASKALVLKRYEMVIERHPTKIMPDIEADKYTFKHHYSPRPSILNFLGRIKYAVQNMWFKNRSSF
ncbi:MAG: nucleotide-diphospho-sugar transferase [Deltaproteobacteria bacterium]|nr:nucleotide-diphospho-sugar transferase [Deltaproteobacteria bacterium]